MMLLIFGPTVTGKTALAIDIAKKLNGEIISADSRQVYKGLDIGTGKVSFDTPSQKHSGYWIVDGIKIHGFDLVEPGQNFTAADFLKFASTTMRQIHQIGKLPIIVGGTGFYIKALTSGIKSIGIPKDQKLRRKLEKLSTQNLYQQLLKLDLSRAKSINESDRQNPRRLIRAIEIATYKKYQGNTKYKILNTKYLIIGLTAPNAYLYQRADNWLDQRLQKGMIDEVKNLLEKKVNPKWLDGLGLEYRWWTRYLTGQIKKYQARERLRGDIHNFIRHQKTWFKQFENISIFDISKPDWRHQLEKTIKDWYDTYRQWAKKSNPSE
ncbi:MAG: tRNA (adenosine(37)-N6)-dimethylallyltransferase MiaA [Patescibacteria group bacterium]